MKNVNQIIKAIAAVLIGVAFISSLAHAQQTNPKKLPPCAGTDITKWTNCFSSEFIQNSHNYTGDYLNGKRHGYGVMDFTFEKNRGDKYVGEFKDGKMNGQGTYTFNDGSEYRGEFSNDMFNGQGTFSFPRGNNAGYIGQWLNGKPHGKGLEFFSDGRQPNQGIFENGQFVSSKKKNMSTPESPYDDPQWKRLIQYDKKNKGSRWVYVNPNYQMRHESVSTIWQLVSFDQAQSLNGATAYGSQLELWEYDCQMKMQRLKAFIRFNNTMGSGLITDELYFEDDGWGKIEKWKLKELIHACK